MSKVACELCRLVDLLEIKTRLYYRDKVIFMVDCNTCLYSNPDDRIMVVFTHHGEANMDDERHALTVIDELFKYDGIRKEGRKIKNHSHWHLLNGRLRGEK